MLMAFVGVAFEVGAREGFVVGFRWVVGGGFPVENKGKGEGGGEGGRWKVG